MVKKMLIKYCSAEMRGSEKIAIFESKKRLLHIIKGIMKKVDVVLGLQWGDEGKGKVVDVLTPSYKVIARFQGGPNAGHSLHFGDTSFVLHTVPSGIFRDGSVNIIGNGVVVDPVILAKEISDIEAHGVDVKSRLLISKKAHIILPTHRILDAASEAAKGKSKIGSTLKGIGPTYMDKTGRNGLRFGDVLAPDFMARYEKLMQVRVAGISCRFMKTRWGSCTSRNRTIRINCMLARYSKAMLEYVVVHEMCHFWEKGHSQAFYELVGRYYPNWKEVSDFLDRVSSEILV